MRIDTLVIGAKEQEYVRRVAEYFRESPAAVHWQITAFTSEVALKHYLKSGYTANLYLLQASFLQEMGEELPQHAMVVRLTAEHGSAAGEYSVLQYQPLPRLLSELDELYRSNGRAGPVSPPGQGAQVIAVYGAAGGIGTTTLALHTAKQAAEAAKRVFYLNLEPCNVTDEYFGAETETQTGSSPDLSTMLYYLQAQPEQATERLRSLRITHAALRMDGFKASTGPEERYSLTPGLAELLLQTIIQCGDYDVIVIDMGSQLDEVWLRLLQSSTLLLWVKGRSEVARQKNEFAIRYVKSKWELAWRQEAGKVREVLMGQSLPIIAEAVEGGHNTRLLSSPVYRGAVARLLEAWLGPEGRQWTDAGGKRSGSAAADSRAH